MLGDDVNDELRCDEYIRSCFQGLRKDMLVYRDLTMVYMQGLRTGRADAIEGPLVQELNRRVKELEEDLRRVKAIAAPE